MIEQRERLPIDPESVFYWRKTGTVYALGQDRHEGEIFFYLFRGGNSLQSAQEKTDTSNDVVGVDIDLPKTHRRKVVNFNPIGLGIWSKIQRDMIDPEVMGWLRRRN